jgi:3-isopropylmalate dehydratase small subunit
MREVSVVKICKHEIPFGRFSANNIETSEVIHKVYTGNRTKGILKFYCMEDFRKLGAMFHLEVRKI